MADSSLKELDSSLDKLKILVTGEKEKVEKAKKVVAAEQEAVGEIRNEIAQTEKDLVDINKSIEAKNAELKVTETKLDGNLNTAPKALQSELKKLLEAQDKTVEAQAVASAYRPQKLLSRRQSHAQLLHHPHQRLLLKQCQRAMYESTE